MVSNVKVMRNLGIIFLIVLILGFLLLTISYMIPCENSFNQINHNGDDILHTPKASIATYDTTRNDMYTDKIILSQISYYNHNVSLIENAMGGYRTDPGNFSQYISGEGESTIHDYPRYWHGHLVIYKPIFYFLDYEGFKVLNLFAELILVISVLALMIERNLKNYCVPFLFSLFFIHLEVIGVSLQFSTVFNLMLLSLIILLKYKEFLFKDKRLLYYFLVVGMVTSYSDLLTYPLVTFAIPMIFCLLLEMDNNNLKDAILKIVLFAVVWTVGYAGMWACKWVISSFVLNKDVITMALNQLLFRVDPNSYGDFSRIDAVLKNVLVYKKRAYMIIFAFIGVYYVKRLISHRKNIKVNKVKRVVPLLIMAAAPFVWYFVACSHSYIHYWFTYRELLIFFLAIFCCAEYMIIDEMYNPNHT